MSVLLIVQLLMLARGDESTTGHADNHKLVEVSPMGSLLAPWDEFESTDDGAPECNWWDGTHQYSLNACGTFEVTRMSKLIYTAALERARSCATLYETDCVLGVEIGLDIPTAFVYDEHEGFKVVVAPRILHYDDRSDHVDGTIDGRRMGGEASEASEVDEDGEPGVVNDDALVRREREVTVRLQHPTDGHAVPSPTFKFNTSITVEYLKGGSRAMEVATFHDTEAFCIQALRQAVHGRCWEQLD
jgi:hypothetical protein